MDFRTRSQKSRSKLAPVRSIRSVLKLSLLSAGLFIYGCASTGPAPREPIPENQPVVPLTPDPQPTPAKREPIVSNAFQQVPGWAQADLRAARDAFLESCKRFEKMAADAPLSKTAPYGGVVADWLPACFALEDTQSLTPDALRYRFEVLFEPRRIGESGGTSKLTGYFEPELHVSPVPTAEHSAAVPGIPSDLVQVEPQKFGKNFGSGRFWGRVVNGELEKYFPRADIVDQPDRALAFADPGDVYYLQIQGSGRLRFPDGRAIRAAFAAHNSRPFESIARHLINTGEITPQQAGMSHVKKWLRDVGPVRAREAMNVNPRYVWFHAEEITDPNKGPKGAQAVPLTPMASMAVDPAYHPYGMPLFLNTYVPAFPGDWKGTAFRQLVIAQDTGGAIKGEKRGDLFYGWGDEAGALAANQNHPLEMWALLPRDVTDITGRTQ